MKKKMNYFNREERNGMILLTFCMLLFISFIFLQKRIMPDKSEINIVYAEHNNEGMEENINVIENLNSAITKDSVRTSSIKKVSLLKDLNNSNSNRKSTNKRKDSDLKSLNTFDQGEEEIKVNAFSSVSEKTLHSKSVKSNFKKRETKSKKFFRKKIKPFSINTQDQETWKSLYGIGPAYAERIVKYQKWLGGFHSKEQIKEVYGITDSLYNELKPFLLDDEPFKRININTVSLDELGRHPYIYWDQAKLLLNYRKHHGDFQSVLDIYKIKELDREQIDKLLPYLDFGIAGKELIEVISER